MDSFPGSPTCEQKIASDGKVDGTWERGYTSNIVGCVEWCELVQEINVVSRWKWLQKEIYVYTCFAVHMLLLLDHL